MQAFNKTLYYLSLYRPKTVLVTDTQVTRVSMGARKTDSKMVEKIEKEFQLKCEAVARSHWSADNGELHIGQSACELTSRP